MFMAPTPSALRALSMAVTQSLLSGAMFAPGFDGGRIPAAEAGALVKPAAIELMIMTPIGSSSVAM
jgi:hypothetical protein